MSGKNYDRLQLDTTALPDADLHHEITRSVEGSHLKSYKNHEKQGNCRRECTEDELVRYMSDLPGYLEKGGSIHEKALNVGVLDWAYLEQWKCSHKHIPHISSRSSISTSNTSVSVLVDKSTGYSSQGRSLSPCQSMCHPPLVSHFMASAMQGYSHDAKSLGKILENCQNFSGSNNNTHSQFVSANDHFSQNLPVDTLKACNMNDLDPKIDMERGALSSDQMYEAASHIKLEMSTQGDKLEKRVGIFQQPNMVTVEKDVLKKNKPPVFCLSRDIYLNGHSGISDLPTSQCQKSQIPSRTSFRENPKELFLEDVNDKKSNSCALPRDVNCSPSQANGCSSLGPERIKVDTATFSATLSAKMRIRPSRSRQDEKKQPIATVLSVKEPFQELTQTQKVTAEKSRSSSPFRRFSFSANFASKGSGCKEDALLQHRSSIGTSKSSSGNMRGCSSSDISGNGKAGEAGRSRSSPLRRLLDPLLKPKTVNCHHSAESSQQDPLLISKGCMSANKSSTELIKDHRFGYSTIDKDGSSKNKKHVSSTVQALLRIAWKNGLPMFTFAVDKNSSILAATVKKLSTIEKDGCSYIYTFFTFRDVDKKAGNWIKQAGKCIGPEYIHHVVAQMKVSSPHIRQNSVDYITVKEFILYSMKLRHGGDQAPDYQPDDELAAIILKIPKTMGSTDHWYHSCSNDNRQELVRATVVLPSGIHSHPSKGGPSSLIERWKSGGSCDCGGWDMGCELKILANENPAGKKSCSSKASCEDHFELFLQGNGREHRPAFRFGPFKHGIFSVAYDSSFTVLQAFSICIALVDCKMPRELSGSRNSVEEKIPRAEINGIKDFNN